MLQPQHIKNRKNIGIELRKTHYTLGNDRIIHLPIYITHLHLHL